MEIYKPSIISTAAYLTGIIDAVFESGYPGVLIRILNTLNLTDVLDIADLSIGTILTLSITGQPDTRRFMSNKILMSVIPKKDYLPANLHAKKLLRLANKEVAKLLIEHNKFDMNTLTQTDIFYDTSDASLDALVESTNYNLATDDYALVIGVIDRAVSFGLDLSVLQKLLDRPDFDPSFDNNRVLRRILRNIKVNRQVLDLVLNNDKVDIYRGGYDLLPILAKQYPEKLLAKLQKDGTINDIEMMNQYVYPYIQQT